MLLGPEDVIELLIKECDAEGSIRQWADMHNIHASLIDAVIVGHRGPGPKLLKALGLEKVTGYRKTK